MPTSRPPTISLGTTRADAHGYQPSGDVEVSTDDIETVEYALRYELATLDDDE